MTRIPGLDAYLTREGPEHTCDPHEPFATAGASSIRGYSVLVYGPDPDAPAVVQFVGPSAEADAERYAEVRNREAPLPNEDGSHGSCTVCGDFHGEPRE